MDSASHGSGATPAEMAKQTRFRSRAHHEKTHSITQIGQVSQELAGSKQMHNRRASQAGGSQEGWFNQSQGYPMGLLPTLGLTKFREQDLTVDDKNPFRVHTNTEKLLIVRERQREFKDFNKLEKEGLRVH